MTGMAERDEFSNQSFGVQITLDGSPPKIAQVLVGRRPAGLYGGSDRSHLTAWRTFVDGIRNLIAGQTPDQAIVSVLTLAGQAEHLLSHGLSRHLRAVPLSKLVKVTKASGSKRAIDADDAVAGDED